jgi:hypothetical protein
MILVGSPIQPETDYLVADPMFKKIYNFYSPDDLVQPADLFSSKGSRRTFKSRSSFTVPDKLKQVCVKVARYNQRNKKKELPLPVPLDYKKNVIKKSLMNPGHIELWYLGWTSTMYRNNFPLHPFPMVDFVSFITTQIENLPKMGNNLTVTLHPQQEIMTVKNKRSDDTTTVPFIPLNKLALLQEKAKQYKPDEDFYQEYATRIDEALHFGRRSKNGGVVRILKEDGKSYRISKAAMCLH